MSLTLWRCAGPTVTPTTGPSTAGPTVSREPAAMSSSTPQVCSDFDNEFHLHLGHLADAYIQSKIFRRKRNNNSLSVQ